jgi:hypothetical protein
MMRSLEDLWNAATPPGEELQELRLFRDKYSLVRSLGLPKNVKSVLFREIEKVRHKGSFMLGIASRSDAQTIMAPYDCTEVVDTLTTTEHVHLYKLYATGRVSLIKEHLTAGSETTMDNYRGEER